MPGSIRIYVNAKDSELPSDWFSVQSAALGAQTRNGGDVLVRLNVDVGFCDLDVMDRGGLNLANQSLLGQHFPIPGHASVIVGVSGVHESAVPQLNCTSVLALEVVQFFGVKLGPQRFAFLLDLLVSLLSEEGIGTAQAGNDESKTKARSDEADQAFHEGPPGPKRIEREQDFAF